MYGANQPIGVAADVEHHDRIAAGHPHLIRRPKAPAQAGKMPELLLPHDSPSDSQARCGLRVADGKNGHRAFLNNPHAYNLYSPTGLVKHESYAKKLRLPPPICQICHFRAMPASEPLSWMDSTLDRQGEHQHTNISSGTRVDSQQGK